MLKSITIKVRFKENLENKYSTFNKAIKLSIKYYMQRSKTFQDSMNISIQKIFSWQERVVSLMNTQVNSYKNIIYFKKEKMQNSINLINQNSPKHKIHQINTRLNNYLLLLTKTIISNFDNHKQKISFQERLIKNSSIERNLNKGYSLILNNKKLIKNKNELKKVNKFIVRFKDGDLEIDKV